MRSLWRQLPNPTASRSTASDGWHVAFRSLSDLAAARREQQQRKAERTLKLLQQFKQRARSNTTSHTSSTPPTPPPQQPYSTPRPPSSRQAGPASTTAAGRTTNQSSSSFYRPTKGRRQHTVQQQQRQQQQRAQPHAEERAEAEEEEEDDDDDDELDSHSSASEQADELRALIQQRQLAYRSRRTHPAVQQSAIQPLTSSLTPSSNYRPLKQPQRTLSLSILGLPNSGKSSLTNRLCQHHITAVSPKSHTTRTNVTAVHTDTITQVQLIIHDTPGILGRHEGKRHERDMSIAAWMAADDVDVVLVCMDAAKRWSDTTTHLFQQLTTTCRHHTQLTPILVLNKIDLVQPLTALLPLAQRCVEACPYIKDVHYISITADDGVDQLITALHTRAQPTTDGWEYDSHTVTDMSPLERVEELIREQLYRRYNKEVPYTVEQRHLEWREGEDWIRVEQQLRVESDAQKSIVIGSGGSGIEWVKREAEREASAVLGKRVTLSLSVQVGKKKDGVTQDGQ